MKITIKEIAKIANVSHSTVSRCLNDSKLVSDKTKIKIKKIADDLGFELNANAKMLSRNKTDTIALFIPEVFGDVNSGLFFSKLIDKLIREFEKRSYDYIINYPHNSHTGKSNIISTIKRKKADAVILAFSETIEKEDYDFLEKSSLPHLYLHFKIKNEGGDFVNSVCSDNYIGAYDMTKYLIDSGHKSILAVKYKADEFEFNERARAYNDCMIKYSLNPYFLESNLDFESSKQLCIENIDFIKKFSVIFLHTDIMAIGFLEGLKECGLKVPDDISIAGYDNTSLGAISSPKLTTVDQNSGELSKQACDIIFEKIESNNKVNIQRIISPKVVCRDSVKIIKK